MDVGEAFQKQSSNLQPLERYKGMWLAPVLKVDTTRQERNNQREIVAPRACWE
jgi:hypothetical protein